MGGKNHKTHHNRRNRKNKAFTGGNAKKEEIKKASRIKKNVTNNYFLWDYTIYRKFADNDISQTCKLINKEHKSFFHL